MITYVKTDLAKKLEQATKKSSNVEGWGTTTYTGLDFTPVRATPGSSGYDLKACIESSIVLHPDMVAKIGTGIKLWIDTPEDIEVSSNMLFTGLILPRSSSKGQILNNTVGVIDSDYQGELFVKYRNVTAEPIVFEVGECFAQLLIVPTWIGELREVEAFENITKRGEGGFGHTTQSPTEYLTTINHDTRLCLSQYTLLL